MENRLRHGSLFSGIGGFDLAAQWMGWENVFHCEKEKYKRKKLETLFPNSISHDDITTTDFSVYRGILDVLTGGFPCQDASIAKQHGQGQQGLQGERTGLFFSMCRAIDEIKPRFVVAENVANILKINGGRDFGTILSNLSRLGYNAEWRVCYASEVGAPHKRRRLYLVAYSDGIRIQGNESFFSLLPKTAAPESRTITGTDVEVNADNEWLCESPFYSMDDGLSEGLAGLAAQIKAYGNAVVPGLVLQLFKAIDQYELMHKTVEK